MADCEWSFPVVFSFRVTINGTCESFQAVEGVNTSMEFEEVHSGGDNSRSFFLPKRMKYEDLVLKKGFVLKDSPLYEWIKSTLSSMYSSATIKTHDVVVSLLDAELKPLASWLFIRAYPYKWSLGSFDAMKNEIVIESVSLKYETFMSV